MRHDGLFQACDPRIALSGTDVPMAPTELVWWAAAQFCGHFTLGKSSQATRVEGLHKAVDQGVECVYRFLTAVIDAAPLKIY